MLNIRELRIQAVGRFAEEQVIYFDQLGNIVQVDGRNNNTGGSSGSGKSTIFNALDYLLGLNDLPNTVLQSRLTPTPMSVTGIGDLDGKPLTITRGRNRFAIDLDGDLTTGSAKITEEKLDQILAMPRNLFRPMLHKRQREGGFFLQMTPRETHEFLTDCLGLSEMRAKLEKLDVKIDNLKKSIDDCDSKHSAADASMKATQEAIGALGQPPSKSVDKMAVVTLKERSDLSMASLRALIERQKGEEAALEAKRPTLQARKFDTSKRDEYASDLDFVGRELSKLEVEEEHRVEKAAQTRRELEAEVYRLTRIHDVGDQLKQEATGVAMQIRSIRECVCPTCEQAWMNEKSKATEVQLSEKLEHFKTKIAEGNQAYMDLKVVKQKIEDLIPYAKRMVTDKMKSLKAQAEEIKELLDGERKREQDFNQATFYLNNTVLKDFSMAQAALRERHMMEQDQVRGQANLDRLALESAVSALKSYDESRAKYDEVLSSLREQYEKANGAVYELILRKTTLGVELSLAEEARRAIKSYTSCSFDDALSEIGDMATRIIRNIPNMANATIQLEGVRETKEGKVKEEVNAVISMDGEIGVPIKSLSGGERSAVDLSIDLAVIDLIEQKTGKGTNLFILDEPFTGLDTVSIEMTLEMLKNSNISKKLILVDHNPEVKQMVESKLTVVRDGSFSKVEQ